MKRIYAIWQDLCEATPFHRERVSVQKQDVIWINLADCRLDPLIERRKSDVFWVTRFVDGIIPGDPGIVLISLCELLPEPDSAVLMVFVVPESGVVGWIVRMPVWILAAGDGVHI